VDQAKRTEEQLLVNLVEGLAGHRFDDGHEQHEIGVAVAHHLSPGRGRLRWKMGAEPITNRSTELVHAYRAMLSRERTPAGLELDRPRHR
jgi:hypothetical protein